MQKMRERREVPPAVLMFLKLFFRYSYSRDAYVLRVVGNSRGPVLRVRSATAKAEKAPPV